MSGDVQPRKRKDKKRKRDSLDRKSEGELIFSRKSSLQSEEEEIIHHGVHATKMGTEDVHLHVQSEHGTGGNWCAKIFFFSLMAILVGLVGLIIMENRGLSDLDTPLQESRFSEYFEGWVDEHREEHHDDHNIVAHEIEEHDLHDEPFDEVEENDSHGADDDDEDEHEEAHDTEEDDHDEDEEDNTAENSETAEDDHDDDDNDDDDETADDNDNDNEDSNDDNNDDDNIEEPTLTRIKRETQLNKEPAESSENNDSKEEDDDSDNDNKINDDNNKNDDDDDDDDDNDDDDENENHKHDDDPFDEKITNHIKIKTNHDTFDIKITRTEEKLLTPQILKKQVDELYDNFNKLAKKLNESEKKIMKTVYEEYPNDKLNAEEDDGTFEDENIVDNDAEELRLLQKKANQASNNNNAADSEESSSTPPLAVKVIVGLALALVARLVLIKKRPEDVTSSRESIEETILIEKIQPNEKINRSSEEQLENETNDQPLEDDYYDDGNEEEIIYSDNEDLEEEIEEIEEEEEIESKNDVIIKSDKDINKYVPETFEQLNAMYRPFKTIPIIENDPKLQVDVKLQTTKTIEFKPRFDENKNFEIFDSPKFRNIENLNRIIQPNTSSNVGDATTSIVGQKIPQFSASSQQMDNSIIEEKFFAAKLAASAAQPERLIDSDEYGENDDDGDDILGEEEIYEEEIEEEEEDDDENADLSDDGDDELMKRLEEKYGKLPVNFDSDEHEVEEEDEEEDPSWTKIKPRSGGAQSYSDEDDLIEAKLERAEEQMKHNNFKAGLKIYESLALKYPDSPAILYGKAMALDNLATMIGSNDMLMKSILAFQRFLALDELISDKEFKLASYNCINRMRSINHYQSAVAIHLQLIKRVDDDPNSRNELAKTYLHLDRYSDAKDILEENLKRWPNNGFSLVNYGYILAYWYKDLENGVQYLRRGIETDENETQQHLFYTILGDYLLILNRTNEAKDIYRKGVAKKLFISEYQRSLSYNKDLKSQPFWTKEETTYIDFFNLFESNWRQIRDEAISVLTEDGYFKDDNENLTILGRWQEFTIISKGKKILPNCNKTAFTCALSELFTAARDCSLGQIKFSVIHPGTHIRPHCGPCNSRLRAHLGLKVPKGARIRVAEEERSWEEGKFLIFDDSFEHEVWHNGNSLRLVLIIDFWHPQVTTEQKNLLKNGPVQQ